MKTAQKLLISASAALSAGLLAAAPATAASLTNIQFDTDDYMVFGSVSGTTIQTTANPTDADAIQALTDLSSITNVELGAASEDQDVNVGFSANLGAHSVRVETVTAADWQGGLAQQWYADFAAAYPALVAASVPLAPGMSINLGDAVLAAVSSGPTRAGDPNIGSFIKDDASGAFIMQLVGHYDVLNAPWLANNPLAGTIAGILGGAPLQISEVAKVTIDGEVSYAYGFGAIETGLTTADDDSSGSGLYAWSKQGTPTPLTESEQVPEPSVMLGLAAVGLLAAAKRKA